ncbi:MAG: hypothetical protein ACSW8H_01505, partial [bacterium]
FPPDFAPRIGPGFSPVTRVAGDSPAHNARPHRSPRNAISINHRDMKSTNFVKLRLHKTVEFSNILLFFAKTLQNPCLYCQFPPTFRDCQSTMGQVKPSRRRKKSAAPGLGATLVFQSHIQFAHFAPG